MDRAEFGAGNVSRDLDLGHVRSLVGPIRIHEAAICASVHLCKVLDAMVALNDTRSDEVEIAHVKYTSAHELLAIQVAASFPGCDRLE